MKFIPFTSYGNNEGIEKCPLCNAVEFHSISTWDRRFKRLEHVKCDHCALVRQIPLPSSSQLEDYYKNRYRLDYQNIKSEPTERHKKRRKVEALGRLSEIAPHLESGAKILDFGCGSGEFVGVCNENGFKASGFEPGGAYSNFAKKDMDLDVRPATWQEVEYETQEFELVTSFHVFEHLIDPVSALKKAKSWLAPNGFIYLETPNISKSLAKGFGCLHFAHTLGFGRYSLEYLGAILGLQVEKVIDSSSYDIGIVFCSGTPRSIDEIARDARDEMQQWSKNTVHSQFWKYTMSKVLGGGA